MTHAIKMMIVFLALFFVFNPDFTMAKETGVEIFQVTPTGDNGNDACAKCYADHEECMAEATATVTHAMELMKGYDKIGKTDDLGIRYIKYVTGFEDGVDQMDRCSDELRRCLMANSCAE